VPIVGCFVVVAAVTVDVAVAVTVVAVANCWFVCVASCVSDK